MSFARWCSATAVFALVVLSSGISEGQATPSDAPTLVGLPNRIAAFRKDAAGGLSYNSAILGQAFEGWKKVPGNVNVSSSPQGSAVGSYIFLVGLATDDTTWINQIEWGQSFVGWQDMHGLASQFAPAIASSGTSTCVFQQAQDLTYKCWALGGGSQTWGSVKSGNATQVGDEISAAATGSTFFLA